MSGQNDEKLAALREHHAVNPQPEAVRDPAFLSGNAFFDARDLVQVKYEMLRRVHNDGRSVTQAAASFGFSRPSFYQAQAALEKAGLPGLLPERPGPRRAHKLSKEVLDFVEGTLAEDRSLRVEQVAEMIEARFRLRVHPRSIQRALARRFFPR
jgi:transposase